jgi:hypothetical protein
MPLQRHASDDPLDLLREPVPAGVVVEAMTTRDPEARAPISSRISASCAGLTPPAVATLESTTRSVSPTNAGERRRASG